MENSKRVECLRMSHPEAFQTFYIYLGSPFKLNAALNDDSDSVAGQEHQHEILKVTDVSCSVWRPRDHPIGLT